MGPARQVKSNAYSQRHDLGILGTLIRIVRRWDGLAGQGRSGGYRFQSSDRNSDDRRFTVHMGDCARIAEAPWAVRDQQTELVVSRALRRMHRTFVALLFPCVTTGTGFKRRSGRQTKRGAGDSGGMDFSRRTSDSGQGGRWIAGDIGSDDSRVCVGYAYVREAKIAARHWEL